VDYLLLALVIVISGLALVIAAARYFSLARKPAGSRSMTNIADLIHRGSMAFLNKEYEVLVVFVIVVSVLLAILRGWGLAVTFIFGAVLSALAGNIGMRVATNANVRTAEATKKSLDKGLRVAFASGTVMGLCVVGLGLLGVTFLYIIFEDPNIIYGFGFGASSIALFARVGGGIYTKAADIGADLVGKIEKKIPEDDPRNPAVIADNVGDNVGDVAGMGADLFESYVDSIIAAMVIGLGVVGLGGKAVILPLIVACLGIVSSIVGMLFVRVNNEDNPSKALNQGVFISAGVMIVLSFVVVGYYTGNNKLFYCIITGLLAGLVIGISTEHYTSVSGRQVRRIVNAAEAGAATDIIEGLSIGMLSTFFPVVSICAAIFISYYFSGLYGIGIAAVGLLSTLGITLATDTYGPVADNAAGIAQMARLGKNVRKRTEMLDAVGNTTAAVGKGFAIGSAALTSIVLFASYIKIVENLTNSKLVISITDPNVIIGLFLGAVLPFVFSSITMQAVGHAAGEIVKEVRRQFKTIKGIMDGRGKPDYERCVSISTSAALYHMVLPSIIAIIIPVLVGLWSLEALGGLLAGVITTGFLLAVFMANSGGAWDNAKKYIEQGNLGGRGSKLHKATIIGDTVGDPLKDCSGPSLNILIKLICIVALIFVPLFL